MKQSMLAGLMVALMFGSAHWSERVQAQSEVESGPSVVVGLGSLDEQFSDTKHLMNAAGFGDMAMFVDAMTAGYTEGIDKTQPICLALYVRSADEQPNVVGFIPVTDIESLLDSLADIPSIRIEENDDELRILMDDGTTFEVKQNEGFVVFSDDSDLLANAAATPDSLLEEHGAKYNFFVKIFGQQIPAEMREQAIDAIREGMEENMQDDSGSMDAWADAQMESLRSLIMETDEMVFGLDIDPDNGAIEIDVSMVGLPNSKMAKQAAAGAEATTKFAGFQADDATMFMGICSTIIEEDIPVVKQSLESARDTMVKELNDGGMSDEERAFVEDIITRMFDVFSETIDEGVMDMAAVGFMDADQFKIAGGARNANPQKFEGAIKDLAQELKDRAASEGVEVTTNFDSGNIGDITLHTLAIQIPDDEVEMQEVFGDSLELVVGIGEDTCYMAIGQESEDLLRKSITGSESASSQLAASHGMIAIAPILEFVHRFQQDEALLDVAESMKNAGNDKIRVTGSYIPNGQIAHIEIQDGLLSAIEILAEQFGPGMADPPAEDF